MSTCLAISILVVVFDQLSKTIVSTNMEVGDSIVIIEKVLSFTYVRNEGAAWGILSDHRWIFLVLTALAIIAIPIITYKLRGFGYFFAIAMSLIWGGAIGNMIDRLFIGSVVDFIEVTFIEYPVFNIADSCVVIGGIMLFIYLVFINKTLFRSEKKKDKKEETNVSETETQPALSSDETQTEQTVEDEKKHD